MTLKKKLYFFYLVVVVNIFIFVMDRKPIFFNFVYAEKICHDSIMIFRSYRPDYVRSPFFFF